MLVCSGARRVQGTEPAVTHVSPAHSRRHLQMPAGAAAAAVVTMKPLKKLSVAWLYESEWLSLHHRTTITLSWVDTFVHVGSTVELSMFIPHMVKGFSSVANLMSFVLSLLNLTGEGLITYKWKQVMQIVILVCIKWRLSCVNCRPWLENQVSFFTANSPTVAHHLISK